MLNLRNKKRLFAVLLLVTLVIGATITLLVYSKQITKKEPKGPFADGVLALNTNKSVYAVNEKVEFGLGSLDEKGDTLCHSKLQLTIEDPTGQKTELSTEKGQIANSSTCSEDNNVTNNPDYTANFVPTAVGEYQLTLTNLDTKKSVENQFQVADQVKFSLARAGATRINPFKSDRYPMIITIQSKEDFQGQVVERIPASFNVIWQGPSQVETVGEFKTITWDVNLKAGETKELIYEYQAPSVSPEVNTLGGIQVVQDGVVNSNESQPWQLISTSE